MKKLRDIVPLEEGERLDRLGRGAKRFARGVDKVFTNRYFGKKAFEARLKTKRAARGQMAKDKYEHMQYIQGIHDKMKKAKSAKDKDSPYHNLNARKVGANLKAAKQEYADTVVGSNPTFKAAQNMRAWDERRMHLPQFGKKRLPVDPTTPTQKVASAAKGKFDNWLTNQKKLANQQRDPPR